MKLIETGTLPLADIEVRDRLRVIDEDWASAIAAKFAQQGQLQDIGVLRVGNSNWLGFGGHRYRAAQLSGWDGIKCKVYLSETDDPEAELRELEISENLYRNELNALDRAANIAELAAINERLYGNRRGGDRKSKGSKVQELHFDFGEEVAAKIGLSRRTIFADLELHNGLSAATRKRVAGTWMADARNQLRDLAKLDAAKQAKALDLMIGEEPKAKKVADAICIIEKRPKAKPGNEQLLAKLTKLWLSSPKKVQRDFIEFLREQGHVGGAE
jgi:ParB family chromosome partitioning protein